jgi:hypothetical protein
MKLTAEQARTLSKPKSIDEKLAEYLDEIYLAIEKYACKGRSDVSIALKPWASSHKEYLFSSLRDNGYKVKFHTYNSLYGEENHYFVVSWNE